jgi:hypothetical protein
MGARIKLLGKWNGPMFTGECLAAEKKAPLEHQRRFDETVPIL